MGSIAVAWLHILFDLLRRGIHKRGRQAGSEMHRAGTVDHQEALIHILIGIQITQTYFISYLGPSLVSRLSSLMWLSSGVDSCASQSLREPGHDCGAHEQAH